MIAGEILKPIFKKAKLPLLDIELILAHVLKKPREFVLAHSEIKLTETQSYKINTLISCRKKGVPLAYLTGHKEFYSLDFIVNKNVLIPRPETEMMVEETMNEIAESRKQKTEKIIIIDAGTGTGCIIITLVKLISNLESPKFNFKFYASDISHKVLCAAIRNAKRHNVQNKIKFLQGDLLMPFYKNFALDPRFLTLIITANLPYLTPAQLAQSASIKHEPKLALSAGKDGLKYYRTLCIQIKKILAMSAMQNSRITILCEIDPCQTDGMKKLIKKYLPEADFQIKKDLSGRDRLVIIKINACHP